ncbi:hypothetical protein SAMN05421823_11317 [Catalinimonas alkaloidigena]|uniref:Right handed beta helix region n=1 Tax=Catalinimonas alkaloidigena TaxID=1075417 RepID=A0A1G9SWJ9_9BACT|nr:hypothetical protein [Catalinimonas alkaloidigena]SDM39773.1 hypothetical protein SAMN05421823_11317 [Catalinimonas alkaloidigena]
MVRTTLLSLGCLALSFSASATILRVNNTPGNSAPYQDLITAHAAAATGDTLYIEGSNTPYGSLDITKRLVIIGPGYYLTENPATPASLPAEVNRLNLNRTSDSDPLSGAAGTQIMGLSFTENSNAAEVNVHVSNVFISKNLFINPVYLGSNDIAGVQVFQNFFRFDGLGYNANSNPGFVEIGFYNNIVERNLSLPANSTGAIVHNLIAGRLLANAFNGEIRSNLFTSPTDNFSYSTAGVGQISHNTAAAGQLGADNNNNVAAASTLFVGTGSTDGKYRLRNDATAAKNNAHDGTDRGPFGGPMPYVLSGQSDIPVIIYLEVPPSVTPSAPFEVTIRAVSRD